MAKSRNKRKSKNKQKNSGSYDTKVDLSTQMTGENNYVTRITAKGMRQYEEIITRDITTWENHEKVLVALHDEIKKNSAFIMPPR